MIHGLKYPVAGALGELCKSRLSASNRCLNFQLALVMVKLAACGGKLCVREFQQQKLWQKVAGFIKYSSWCTGVDR